MAEFDEKLNSLLSNPDAMAQIMQLAQSLGSGESTPPPQAEPSKPASPPVGELFSSLTGGADPSLMLKLLPLVQDLGQDSDARRLVYALRPYLKPERQDKVERALQLAKL